MSSVLTSPLRQKTELKSHTTLSPTSSRNKSHSRPRQSNHKSHKIRQAPSIPNEQPPGAFLVSMSVAAAAIAIMVMIGAVVVAGRSMWEVKKLKSFLGPHGGKQLTAVNDLVLASQPHWSPIFWMRGDWEVMYQKCSIWPHLADATIFVAISSFRDRELTLTLQDLFDKSFNRTRIFVGVVEQNHPTQEGHTAYAKNAIVDSDHIRIISMHFNQASGPTTARHLCETLYRGEEYHLMVDSHMRFEPGWDVELIQMLWKCRRPRRTVITCYPEGYQRQEEKDPVTNKPTGNITYKHLMRRGHRDVRFKFFNDVGVTEFESVTTSKEPPARPTKTAFYGACFAFCHSDGLKLVPYSPKTPFLFFGEEQLMAVRYFTHGFDLMNATHSVLFHLWVRKYRKTMWEKDVKNGYNGDNVKQRDNSIQWVNDICTGKVVDDKYGLGQVRSFQDYWRYAGLDPFKKTTIRKPWAPDFSVGELDDEFVVPTSQLMLE